MSVRSKLLAIKRQFRNNYAFYNRIAPVFGLYRNARMALARISGGIDGNLVTFSAFDGRSYNDSPRLISEALHARRPETEIVWLFADPEAARRKFDIPDYVRPLNAIGSEGVRALARCRVAVDNFNKRFYLNFPGKGQFYLQTWHGDRPFKKIGCDDPERHSRMLEERATAVMAGSEFGERVLRSAFRYKGEVLLAGCPRNDSLVRNDPAEREAVRRKLGLEPGVRYLLYAPTFRDADIAAHRKQRVSLNLNRALDRLEAHTGESWRCLVRGHYFAGNLDVADASGRLIPASDFPEMADLLLASDALLTDYSSCAGDFVLLGRPIYLYQDDAESYERENRAFYFPMRDYDYWIARTPEELDRLIEETTPERTAENCRRIIDFYGMRETGRATEAAVDYITSKLDASKGSSK